MIERNKTTMLRKMIPSRSEMITATTAFLVVTAFSVISPLAHAQGAEPVVVPPSLVATVIASLPTWLATAVLGLGFFAGAASSLSLLFGFLGAYWPPFLKVAAMCSKGGIELHQLGAWLASFLPATAAKRVGGAAVLLLAIGLGFSQTACSAAQKQTETTVANAVLTDANKVCLGVEAALPLLGLPAPTVAEADQVCNIVGIADPVIQSFLDGALSAATPAVTQAQAKLAAHARGQW